VAEKCIGKINQLWLYYTCDCVLYLFQTYRVPYLEEPVHTSKKCHFWTTSSSLRHTSRDWPWTHVVCNICEW